MQKHILLAFFTLVAALLVNACGGGSGGTGGVRIFLTDTFREDYDHVYLTIYKVEYRNASTGEFTTAWESSTGLVVDAKRLRDTQGERYAFLCLSSLPAGTYDAVRITLGNQTTLVPTGNSQGEVRNIDSSLPRDSSGRPMVNVSLTPPLTVPDSSSFVLDIDLANWSVNGSGEVVPAFRRCNCTPSDDDPSRHEALEYTGTVSNLTDTRFTLQPHSGAAIQVSYNNTTQIYNSSDGAPAVLRNGLLVEVRGVFVSGVLEAYTIKVEDGDSGGEHEAHGRHINVDLNANTMELTDLGETEGFVPGGSSIIVAWDDSTVFRRSGVRVTEDALNQWQFSEVKGTYDAHTNTLHATRITLDDDEDGSGGGDDEGEAEAKGTNSEVDLDANTMTLTNIFDVEGFTPQGTSVHVSWTDETIFRRNGAQVTEQALLQFPRAEVKGVYDSGSNTIRASRIEIED